MYTAINNQPMGVTQVTSLIHNLISIGTIIEIDAKTYKAKVLLGKEQKTNWLPIITNRAGNTKTASILDIGEQVLVLCLNGDIEQGFILGSINQEKYSTPTQEKEEHVVEFKDGTKISYNQEHSQLQVASPKTIKITAQKVVINSNDISLGGSGGKKVARIGDSITGTCSSHGASVSGRIASGSSSTSAV